MRRKVSQGFKAINKVATAGGIFDRRDELVEVLRQGPPAAPAALEATDASAPTMAAVAPSRWRLRTIRDTVPWLQSYSLSGVWYLLRRYRLRLRTASVQQYSPDPDYLAKVDHLLACLRQTAATPQRTVCLFLDEMGYYRWPTPAPVWWPAAPTPPPSTDRQESNQQQWRLIGVLNALTGQVDYRDGYIVGRAKVIAMYQQIATAYDWADHIFVAQDNWNIHTHEDVMTALKALPQIEPVWLPTYAPWLNPIEKALALATPRCSPHASLCR